MIDLYCERLEPVFWSEPINALTNIAFFIAAGAVWRLGSRMGKISFSIGLLIGLIFAIGTGSFLFHTFATNFTRLLDVLPILLFQFVFTWVYIRQIIKIKGVHAIGIIVVFILSIVLARQFPDSLNGSLSYAPAFVVLFGVGVYHFLNRKKEKYILLSALGVFTLALFFRTIDASVCPYFPVGTHFIWHILNGVLVYLIARALILNLPLQAN